MSSSKIYCIILWDEMQIRSTWPGLFANASCVKGLDVFVEELEALGVCDNVLVMRHRSDWFLEICFERR